MMRRGVSLARAGFAGFVWAVISGIPFLLSRLFNGDTASHPTSAVGWVALLFLTTLYLSACGLILALPFSALLDVWEVRSRPDAQRFLMGSLLSSGCWAAVLVFCYMATNPHDYYPDVGFSGTARVVTVSFVAALSAGYAVGRYLPQTGNNPVARTYEKYRVWLWAEFLFGILILLSLLFFPTFGGSFLSLAMVW